MSLELVSTSGRRAPGSPLVVRGHKGNVTYLGQDSFSELVHLALVFECGEYDLNQTHALLTFDNFFSRNREKSWENIMRNLEFHSLVFYHRDSIVGDAGELRVWLSNILSSRGFDLRKATNDILGLISWRHAPFAANDEHYSESESGPDRWYEELICLYVRVVGTICDTATRVPALCRGISARIRDITGF